MTTDDDQRSRGQNSALDEVEKQLSVDGPVTDMTPSHHVVVGFDRHPSSQQALRFAITLAAPLNAHLHVAHIVDLEDFPIDPDSDDWEQRLADALAQERTVACDLLAGSAGKWTYTAHHATRRMCWPRWPTPMTRG